MPLGWAIVSTGLHPDNKIAPAINAADAFAQKHGAKAAYDSLDALLQDSRVDAVFIALPNFLHLEHTLPVAKAGKHVLVEKPMATTLEDSVAMVRSCREAGVKLATGYHLRTHPGHILARRLILEGTLGQVVLAPSSVGLRCPRGKQRHRPGPP